MTVCIPGKAVGKQSVRIGDRGICYIPKQTKNFEALIGSYVRNYMMSSKKEKIPEGTPVFLILYIYKKIPSSWPNSKKILARNGHIRPTVKPDNSNVLKSVEDAMNKIAYDDDRQIVDHIVRKFYADQDWIHIEIKISPDLRDFMSHVPQILI
jgi:Holliday junction resolvase RusA-like endonuclease